MLNLTQWWGRQAPVGKNKPFVVTCDSQPYAGFDTRKEADEVRDIYAKVPAGKATTRKWEVRDR